MVPWGPCWLQVLETLESCSPALLGVYPSAAVGQVCSASGVNPCHVCYCQGLSGSPVRHGVYATA